MIRKAGFDADDPRLVAYALGDLSELEHAEIEALLRHSPEAQSVVAEIRATADQLGRAFEVELEGEDEMGPERRETIASALLDAETPPARLEEDENRSAGSRSWLRPRLAAAAAVLVACAAYAWWQRTDQEAASPETDRDVDVAQNVPAPTAKRVWEVKSLVDRRNQLRDLLDDLLARNDGAGAAKVARNLLDMGDRESGTPALYGARLASGGTPAPSGRLLNMSSDPVVAPPNVNGAAAAWAHQLGLQKQIKGWTRPGKTPTDKNSHFESFLPMSRIFGHTFENAVIPPKTPGQHNVYSLQTPAPAQAGNNPSNARNKPALRTISGIGTVNAASTTMALGNGTRTNSWHVVLPQGVKGQTTTHGFESINLPIQLGSFASAGTGISYGETYTPIVENAFRAARDVPLSTFALDVDTAAYANVRRFLEQRQLPPRDAVRIEEMVNYFSYGDPAPQGNTPVAVSLETSSCPWALEHRLVRIGLKGKEIPKQKRPPSNLVFLVDVSGSMQPENKLPLLKSSLVRLTETLEEKDRVAIVTYAQTAKVALESTFCHDPAPVTSAIGKLLAGGSTNGAAGLDLAYEQANAHFIKGGINRVIVCTDGDFNVGITAKGDLVKLIREKAQNGVFLSVLGFGGGNLKEERLEHIANRGNGNYSYIDSLEEAEKVLVREAGGTLQTIAKDVKLQLEFNPATVQTWRLLGFENRALAARNFNDDRKDGGELGSGATATALYEIIPVGIPAQPGVDSLKYQQPSAQALSEAARSGELLTVKLRYKEPEGTQSKKLEMPLKDDGSSYDDASTDLRFATAVAAYGMILRGSKHRGTATLEMVLELAKSAIGEDPGGDRAAFVELVERTLMLGDQ